MSSMFNVVVLPRESMSWQNFLANTPPGSIALDGLVSDGGPNFNPITRHVNFDHHSGVVREATMSTAMQVYIAIKGGFFTQSHFAQGACKTSIYINDTDQDTSLAIWLLFRHKEFEGVKSIPHINRLLALTDRLDITGGAFPMNLDDSVVRQHNWVFRPYTDLRKSGALALATGLVLRDNLEAVLARLDKFLMGQAEEVELDTRHIILFDSAQFKIVDEIGGNEARYYLFGQGMNAFISIVARRPDGRIVYTAGRRSRYIEFPIPQLRDDYNKAEGLGLANGWGGSDIVIGSSRMLGSGLPWETVRDITLARLK